MGHFRVLRGVNREVFCPDLFTKLEICSFNSYLNNDDGNNYNNNKHFQRVFTI